MRRAIESSQKVSLGYVRQKSARFWSNRTWPFNPDTIGLRSVEKWKSRSVRWVNKIGAASFKGIDNEKFHSRDE